jgi:hypothetical protein
MAESCGMTTTGSGSVYLRKALGARLLGLRLAAGKTYGDVRAVGSPSKMRRIEAGEPPIRLADVRTLCFMYGADAGTTEQLAEMSLSVEEDWWEYYNIPSWMSKYVALETISSTLTVWDEVLIHGLLQTPDYHRAIYLAETFLPPDDLERHVSLRTDRQTAAFARKPPFRITQILGEGALRRQIGGPKVMGEQIKHLLELIERREVGVFVLPWDAGAHSALSGAFMILGNDAPEYPDVVYLETLSGGRYIGKREIVERYRQSADALLSEAVTLKEFLS